MSVSAIYDNVATIQAGVRAKLDEVKRSLGIRALSDEQLEGMKNLSEWDASIALLKEIVEKKPDSEYGEKAARMLEDAKTLERRSKLPEDEQEMLSDHDEKTRRAMGHRPAVDARPSQVGTAFSMPAVAPDPAGAKARLAELNRQRALDGAIRGPENR